MKKFWAIPRAQLEQKFIKIYSDIFSPVIISNNFQRISFLLNTYLWIIQE